MRDRCRSVISSQRQEFRSNAEDKARSIEQIAPPQAARFLHQTKRPLEAMVLHPGRSLFGPAAVEIERRSHANHHGDAKLRSVFMHPSFLFGRAQTDPENIWIRGMDPVDNF